MRGSVLVGAILLLAAAVSLTGCGNQPGTIAGQVTDALSGDAVPRARVVLSGLEEVEGEGQLQVFKKSSVLQEEHTDQAGLFSFTVEPDSYQVEVWFGDNRLQSRLVEVRPGRTTKVELQVTLP